MFRDSRRRNSSQNYVLPLSINTFSLISVRISIAFLFRHLVLAILVNCPHNSVVLSFKNHLCCHNALIIRIYIIHVVYGTSMPFMFMFVTPKKRFVTVSVLRISVHVFPGKTIIIYYLYVSTYTRPLSISLCVWSPALLSPLFQPFLYLLIYEN